MRAYLTAKFRSARSDEAAQLRDELHWHATYVDIF